MSHPNLPTPGGRAAVLAGLGAHLPPRALDNAELCGSRPVGDEWIRTHIGSRSRRIADGEAVADLAVRAGRLALTAAAPVPPVDAVVLVSTAPERLCPAAAPEVAARLGLGTVPAFDLAAGCSGFLYGLSVAAAMVAGGGFGRVLLVASDVFSAFTAPEDWLMRAIFGDGAGAVVLRAGRAGEPGAIGPFDLGSDGAQADLLEIPGGAARARRRPAPEGGEAPSYFRMDGPAVRKQAVVGMADSVTRALAAAGWDAAGLDALVAHQANQRILDGLAAELGLPAGRVLSHIERYGNTAAASVPVLLAQAAAAGTLVPGARVALTAYGAGLAWGSTTLVWPDVRALTEGG